MSLDYINSVVPSEGGGGAEAAKEARKTKRMMKTVFILEKDLKCGPLEQDCLMFKLFYRLKRQRRINKQVCELPGFIGHLCKALLTRSTAPCDSLMSHEYKYSCHYKSLRPLEKARKRSGGSWRIGMALINAFHVPLYCRLDVQIQTNRLLSGSFRKIGPRSRGEIEDKFKLPDGAQIKRVSVYCNWELFESELKKK